MSVSPNSSIYIKQDSMSVFPFVNSQKIEAHIINHGTQMNLNRPENKKINCTKSNYKDPQKQI